MNLSGVVLAGGRSTRMGRDKATLEVGGVPMAARLGAVLREAGVEEVVSVGGDLDALAGFGFDAHPDRWPGDGPLGGLVTGLEVVTRPAAVVLACDLPALRAEVVVALATRYEAARTGAGRTGAGRTGVTGVDALVPVVAGRRQPLAAVYRSAVAPTLRRSFEEGRRSLRAGLDSIEVEEWPWPGDPDPFIDVDGPGDLAQLASVEAAAPERP